MASYRGKRSGEGAILRRMGRRGASRVKTLFSFSPKADIEASLEFELTAQMVFQETMDRNLEASFDQAIRTAR